MSVKITTSQKRPVLVMGCGLGGYLVDSDGMDEGLFNVVDV